MLLLGPWRKLLREHTSLGSARTSRGAPNAAEACGLSQAVMFANADTVGVGDIPATGETTALSLTHIIVSGATDQIC